MLTTLRRDRRTRRQAQFNLESLDDRLVLSAGAGGAAAEAVGAKAAAIEHRHEARLARHEAKLARMERGMRPSSLGSRRGTRPRSRPGRWLARAAASAAAMSPITRRRSVPRRSAMGSASATGRARQHDLGAAPVRRLRRRRRGRRATDHDPARRTFRAVRQRRTSPDTGRPPPGTGTSSSPGTLPANVAAALQSLYQEYETAGGGDSFTPEPAQRQAAPDQRHQRRGQSEDRPRAPTSTRSSRSSSPTGCRSAVLGDLRPDRRHVADRRPAGRGDGRGERDAGLPADAS